jgi:hypothetical protein
MIPVQHRIGGNQIKQKTLFTNPKSISPRSHWRFWPRPSDLATLGKLFANAYRNTLGQPMIFALGCRFGICFFCPSLQRFRPTHKNQRPRSR